MGLFDKIKDLAGQHAEKVEGAIEKVADVVDEKTGGRYAEHIDQGAEAARDYLDGEGDGVGGPGAGPAPRPPLG